MTNQLVGRHVPDKIKGVLGRDLESVAEAVGGGLDILPEELVDLGGGEGGAAEFAAEVLKASSPDGSRAPKVPALAEGSGPPLSAER